MKNLFESINNHLNESVEDDINEFGNKGNLYADIVNKIKNKISDFSDRDEVRSELDEIAWNEPKLRDCGFDLETYYDSFKNEIDGFIRELDYDKQKQILNQLVDWYGIDNVILQTLDDNTQLSICVISLIIEDLVNSI